MHIFHIWAVPLSDNNLEQSFSIFHHTSPPPKPNQLKNFPPVVDTIAISKEIYMYYIIKKVYSSPRPLLPQHPHTIPKPPLSYLIVPNTFYNANPSSDSNSSLSFHNLPSPIHNRSKTFPQVIHQQDLDPTCQ